MIFRFLYEAVDCITVYSVNIQCHYKMYIKSAGITIKQSPRENPQNIYCIDVVCAAKLQQYTVHKGSTSSSLSKQTADTKNATTVLRKQFLHSSQQYNTKDYAGPCCRVINVCTLGKHAVVGHLH